MSKKSFQRLFRQGSSLPKNKASIELDLSKATTYANIRTLLAQCQYEDVKQACHKYLTNNKNDAEINHLLGVAYLQTGKLDKAINYIEIAVSLNKTVAQYANNLGEAYRRKAKLDQAVSSFEQALQLNPDYAQAHYNLGCTRFAKHQYTYALQSFEKALNYQPKNSTWLAASADAAREQGKFKLAKKRYQEALDNNPENASALANFSAFLLLLGQPETAYANSQKAVSLQPKSAIAHLNLACCLVERDELDEAMNAFADAYELQPDSPHICTNIGNVWLQTGDTAQAFYWFQQALKNDPEDIEALCGMATAQREAGNIEEAEKHLLDLLEKHPEDYRIYSALGQTYWDQGDSQSAIKHLEKAIHFRPTIIKLHVTIGSILASAGKVDLAIEAYQRALTQNKNCVPALSGLATSLKGKLNKTTAQRLLKLSTSKNFKEGTLASIFSGLSYYYDGVKNYPKAAEAIEKANDYFWKHKLRRGWEYNAQLHHKNIKRLIKTFSPEFFKRTSGFGLDTITPVFIVGMPRSGTTLTEQILASHPLVLGIGERNFASLSIQKLRQGDENIDDYPDICNISKEKVIDIAKNYLKLLEEEIEKSNKKGVKFVVDKMPDNYQLLGWLATIFPNARFIHSRRDVRDVAVSCWMTQFRELRWAFDQQNLAARIIDYQLIMNHWEKVLPVDVLQSQYEHLVSEPEENARKLVDWLNLEWDDNCLKFQKNKQLVRTASVTQVRQPIYTKSIARWKHYEKALSPLLTVLDNNADMSYMLPNS